ncbi:MAG: hypothetical protein RQ824_00585 [bacterium]|nr:hypothetical protein [bacterium]
MKNKTEYAKRSYGLLWIIAGVLIVVGSARPALAVKVIDVSATKHNLGSGTPVTSNWYSTDESEVCVFCHTPHNAISNYPLWNQYSTTMSFTVYSSGTLTAGVYATGLLPANSMSRLCLSCHEGTIAINALANPGSTVGRPAMAGGISGDQFSDVLPAGAGAYLSSDLSAMHPIGFDYNLSDAGDPEINDITTGPLAQGLKFIKGAGGEDFLECVTCHDPHVNGEATGDPDYKFFLRIPNKSSALCLACHNK